MAYRFVLEVPEAVHEDAKVAIGTVRDAMILIERHPHVLNPDEARTELSVVAHSLDVVDALYRWMAEGGVTSNVILEAYKGERVDLTTLEPRALRRLVQGDQYWYENTVPRLRYIDHGLMESGVRVADVPYGGRAAVGTALVPAESRVTLGAVDHIAVRVRDMARAEEFYRDLFGMDVMYRARREGERWQYLDPSYDYLESIQTGVEPEIVRLENGPVALLLVNAGAAAVMHESRVDHVSLSAPMETLNALRGQVLFASYTLQEDSARAFRFVDPFGITWQIVANE